MRRLLLLTLALILAADTLAAQERVLVRRLSDVVVVREGDPAKERVLYYFAPTAQLAQGDHLEQGSGGQSEILLSAGGLVSMHAAAHVILKRISANGDVLQFPLLTTLQARAGDRLLSLSLPGGTRCTLQNTEVFVSIESGRMRIRNQGGQMVVVQGDLVLRRGTGTGGGRGSLQLKRGEEILLPLFDVSGGVGEGSEIEMWGVLPVRHSGGATLEQEGDRLRLSVRDGTDAEAAAAVTVGGVSTLPGTTRLMLHNPGHLELPPPPEPVEPDEPAMRATEGKGVEPAAEEADQDLEEASEVDDLADSDVVGDEPDDGGQEDESESDEEGDSDEEAESDDDGGPEDDG